ncbi:MAG TPA: OmpA family protein [Humidesulfovibrio sp.]|uniref:OmpA family protein n=1 Tax=Humidesulfovibrio sp. TaxID=2910988 RepID=UPI002C5B2D9C|nr:OmpA family protein [Humidesulfovibrio sp.]HWR05039.1 OmpA family protein [Humidesulfovibrio sp.]
MKRSLFAIFLALFTLLGLAACANLEPGVTQQTKVYRDAPVEKSRLAINVRPKSRLYDSPQVLMYPFWVAQKMDNHMLVGRELARLFHQTWTGLDVFQTLAYDPQLVYRGPEQAISVARRAGADLVVVGIIPYLITGGSVDSTAITLQIRIYETKSGNLLLSMDQSARVNSKRTQDWILFSIETRLSDSPIAEAIASIAGDMAVPIKSWLPPTDEELGFADNSQAMTRNILASGGYGAGGQFGQGAMDARGMAAGLANGEGANNSLKLKVEFDFDSARIREESFGLLNELAKALKSDSLRGRKVVLAGHCDIVGTDEYNQKLSERRAASVKAYLTSKGGVDPGTIRTVGYGKSRPLVPNTSAANKQRNRRVEVSLDGQGGK